MITVTQLTKRYARNTAVDQISFEVEKGRIVGFLGPNGAGKTTTMRMLTCFLPAHPAALSGNEDRRVLEFCGQSQGTLGKRCAQASRLRLPALRHQRCEESAHRQTFKRLPPACGIGASDHS